MRISLKFLSNAFSVMVLFLGTGAFLSLAMDRSNPDVVTDGSMWTQLGWTLIYIVVLVRVVPRHRQIWQAVKSNRLLIFLVLLALISAAWSQDGGLTVRRGLAVLGTTLFAIDFAVRYSLRDQVRLFQYALGLAVGLSVFVELFFHGLVPTVDTVYPNAWNGAFVQKNDFARFVVLLAIIVLMRTRAGRRQWLVATATIAASFALILLCHSRTALVVFAAMLTLMPIFRLRRRGSKALFAGIVGVLLLSASAAVFVDIGNLTELLGRDATLTGRTNIWALALESASERPLLGYGYSAFWNVAVEADRISSVLHWKVPHAHNGFIDLTLQLGLVGLGLLIAVYYVAIRGALRLAQDGLEREALWPLAYLAFTLLYQVTESTIFVGNTVLWMGFVATVCSASMVRVESPAWSPTADERVQSFVGREELA